MINVVNLHDGIELYKALGSEIRVAILELILQNDSINLNEIARTLNLTNGALTAHIKKLEDVGLITLQKNALGNKNHKIYRVAYDRILTELRPVEVLQNVYQSELKPGLYTDFKVFPTCGVALPDQIIGDYDDPRYYFDPRHVDAELVWFAKGYVEYTLPTILPPGQKIDQIVISAELSSEAPASNDFYPSDIFFSINGKDIGYWTSPGDFGSIRGRYTPDWWSSTSNQYGLLKTLVINHEGSFIDSIPISDVTIDVFRFTSDSTIRFRMSVREDAQHVGGLTIFGRHFGNFDQNINIQIFYSPLDKAAAAETGSLLV